MPQTPTRLACNHLFALATASAHNHRRLAALTAALLTCGVAQATCWRDQALSQLAVQLSQELMPELRNVPQVQVCTDEHFPAPATGQYTSGVNLIQVRPSAVSGAGVRSLLIHELAHAQVAEQYGPQTFANGHGAQWMDLMVRLGRVEDARFHASVYPEAMPAFQQALASVGAGTDWADSSTPRPHARPRVEPQTTMSVAEAELRSIYCAHVLRVPPQGGVHGYVLGAFFPAFTPLPSSVGRIQSVRWPRPGVLELVALPSPDGTPSLLCLR